jgi:hypothetical protein
MVYNFGLRRYGKKASLGRKILSKRCTCGLNLPHLFLERRLQFIFIP